jgi:hypothetical protein
VDPLAAPLKKFVKLNQYLQQRAANGDKIYGDVHSMFESAVKSGVDGDEMRIRLVHDLIMTDAQINPEAKKSILYDAHVEESIAAVHQESSEIDILLEQLQIPRNHDAAPTLWPTFKNALKFLDEESYRGGSSTSRESSKQSDNFKKWSELPGVKEVPWEKLIGQT